MSKALGMLRTVERSRLFSAARTVLTKEGKVGGWRRKSNAAASVSSDVPSSWGGRKRVSKEERCALVESYVNEYRKRNDGKFPTVTDTIKHAGGSYYAVRKIVQELEYASKLHPPTSRTIISEESEHTDEKKSLTGVSKFRQRATADVGGEESAQKVADNHIKRIKEDRKDTSISPGKLGDHKSEADNFHETDFNKLHTKKVEQHEVCEDVDHAKDDLRKQTEKLGVDPKDGVVKHTRRVDFTGSATWEAKEHHSHSPSEPEESAKRKDDAEHSGETSFWGSLKTFADDIISIWRRK